ncbi:MAG: hypothetical protein KDK39_12050 [Leptospiraceae bacterium]|nr:hypothetical protein [Leptospiraceae bacterium]
MAAILVTVTASCKPLQNVEKIEPAEQKKWFISEKKNVLETNFGKCEFRDQLNNALFIYKCDFERGYPVYITINRPGFCKWLARFNVDCIDKLQKYTLGDIGELDSKVKEWITTGLRSRNAFDSEFFFYLPENVYILGYRDTPSTSAYSANNPEEYELLIATPEISYYLSGIKSKSDLKYIMQHLDYSRI